jgi:hypothetical protein
LLLSTFSAVNCPAKANDDVLLLSWYVMHTPSYVATSEQELSRIIIYILYNHSAVPFTNGGSHGGNGNRTFVTHSLPHSAPLYKTSTYIYIPRLTSETNKLQRFAQHAYTHTHARTHTRTHSAQSGLEWSLFYLPVPKRDPCGGEWRAYTVAPWHRAFYVIHTHAHAHVLIITWYNNNKDKPPTETLPLPPSHRGQHIHLSTRKLTPSMIYIYIYIHVPAWVLFLYPCCVA